MTERRRYVSQYQKGEEYPEDPKLWPEWPGHARRPYIPFFNAIVVLGARLKFDAKRGVWTAPTIVDEDPGKLVAGKSRALAASYARDLTPLILVTGGMQRDGDHVVSRAAFLRDLMVNRYGVEPRKVITVGGGQNTLDEVEDVVGFIRHCNFRLPGSRKYLASHLGVLTSFFHMSRAMSFFENNPFFKDHAIELTPWPAELSLGAISPHHERWVEKVAALDEYHVRYELELRGYEAIRRGVYHPLNSK